MRVRKEGVHVTEVDGTAVVLDTNSSKYLTLSGSGALLLGILQTGDRSIDELSAILVEHYGISAAVAHDDCLAFTASLATQGLLIS